MERGVNRTTDEVRIVRALEIAVPFTVGLVAAWLVLSGRQAEAMLLLTAGIAAASLGPNAVSAAALQFAAVAAVLNAAGYTLALWKNPQWFDEVVHFTTGLAVILAIGWLITRTVEARVRGLLLVALLTVLGLALATLWEGLEWSVGMIGSTADTIVDVLLASIGGFAAALLCVLLSSRRSEIAGRSIRGGKQLSTWLPG